MTKEELIPELRAHIARKYRTQRAAASAWGVSGAFVSGVLNGHKRPTTPMLDDMGLVAVPSDVQYFKKSGRKAKEG